MTRMAVFSIALLSVVGLDACGHDPVRPSTQPEIDNATDSFRFQMSPVTNFSTDLAYTWRNTGVTANVDQSSAITTGVATLTIKDANGAMVYSRSLVEQGTFTTVGRGGAGNWRIEVAPPNVTGTLNFRVQGAPQR